MPPDELKLNLAGFVSFTQTLKGDEKSESQTFLDRFFRALGHEGAIEAGATPSVPTKTDLDAVAERLFAARWNVSEQEWNIAGSTPCRNFIRLVVGYALTCKMPLPAVADTIEEARYQARKSGRTHIAAVDLRNALLDFRIPSDAALQRAFERPEKHRKASHSHVEALAGAAQLRQRCNGFANVLR